MRRGARDWAMLLALTVMWGSAFLLTKVAVREIPFSWVVSGRLTVAAALLIPLATVLVGQRPRGRRTWLFLLLMAVTGNLLPFSLIAWGQGSIDSGLAGILMAVMPLATLSLAHFLIPGERLTPYRIGGFALGFLGVVVLVGPASLQSGLRNAADLWPMLAVLAGAWCYAVSAVLARLRPPGDALTTAAAVTALAALLSLIPAPTHEHMALPAAISPAALVALLCLGIFSTAIAAVVYFQLVATAGPAFVSQLNYFIPLWAVGIGILFLGETPQPNHLYALVCILAGVVLTQLERRSS